MSAIALIYNLNHRPVGERALKAVLDRMEHRGTDAQGVILDDFIGFGHRMRWTTPESLDEKLPLKGKESGIVITCDARIDNRDELIPQLSFGGKKTEEIADSEIILRAYEKWGEDCLPKLIGDFVFAIWDPKRQKLVCARDSMGIKHFYYYYKPGQMFALASEVKGLYGIAEIPRDLNETNIGDILILNYQDKENTPYRDIKRLPANSVLTLQENRLEIRQYWQPQETAKFRFRSNRRYEEEFREIFTKSVASRLRSAFPVGSMLSGGLDSSAISCVASRHLRENDRAPLETFSAIFPTIAEMDPRIDERKYINSVIEHIDCHPNFVEADSFSPLEDMDKLQWHTDHPVGAPNVFMDWALFKAAGKRDVRVLLSGFDGDSTVSYGYEAFQALARQGQWFQLLRSAAALNKNMPNRHHEFKKLVWNQGFRQATPEFVRKLWRVVHGKPGKEKKSRTLPSSLNFNYRSINPKFAEKQDLKARYFHLVEESHPPDAGHIRSHWNALCSGLFAFALETFEKAAAAFEIEARFPFFDRRLIEFCIALPAKQKIYNGWTRSIFRRAMEDILPTEVQWRTDKANIGLSFKVNLLKYGSRDVEETIFDFPDVLEKYVDIKNLSTAYRRYKDDPLKYEGEPMFIISSVYLSNWLRRTLEANAA
ncbi:MAG: lasso peptide isopeptide bond-forming cyclase [Pyrinomonadaceae bacterium]